MVTALAVAVAQDEDLKVGGSVFAFSIREHTLDLTSAHTHSSLTERGKSSVLQYVLARVEVISHV